MSERRRTKRKYLLYYGRVYDETEQKQLGYLVDITEEGFMLLSDNPIPVGAEHRIKLEVTTDIAPSPFIRFKAKSVWSEPDIDPKRYNNGFVITELDPADKGVIDMIIKEYGFRDN